MLTFLLGTDYNRLPLVVDTGVSLSLTPFNADFVDYVLFDIHLNTVDNDKYVVVIRNVIYILCTMTGDNVFLLDFRVHVLWMRHMATHQSFTSSLEELELGIVANMNNYHREHSGCHPQ